MTLQAVIEVTLIYHNGRRDTAEADTPENAVFAGRTLWDEAAATSPERFAPCERDFTLIFAVDGKTVCIFKTRP